MHRHEHAAKNKTLRLLCILNRHASSLSSTTPEVVTRELQRTLSGLSPHSTMEILIPDTPEALRSALAERLATSSIDRVVSCGGDGTLGEILPVMVQYPDIPLAIIPMGTGNLLAVNLGIPFSLSQALSVALGEHFRAVDIGCLTLPDSQEDETRLFILNTSVGLDAEIMHQTEKPLKRRWGWLAYFIRGIPLLPSVRPSRLHIETDDGLISTSAIGVTVSNVGARLQGGLALHPDAKPDDGLLHGTILRPRSALDYLTAAFRLIFALFGRHRRDVIRVFSSRRIRIAADPPLKVQTDGNVVGLTPAEITLIPTRLKICIPRQAG